MILHIVRFFKPHLGGNENQAYNLIKSLKEESQYDYSVLTYRYKDELEAHECISGIDVFREGKCTKILNRILNYRNKTRIVIFRKILSFIYANVTEMDLFFSFYGYIKRNREKIDIIHVHQLTTIAFVAALCKIKYGIPIIVKDATTDGISFFDKKIFGGYCKNKIIQQATFVAMTKIIKHKLLQRGVLECNIVEIPNGFHVNRKKGKYSENKTILFLGNFDQGPIKGLDILIEAFFLLYFEDKEFKLIVAGRGDSTNFVNLLIKRGVDKSSFSFVGEINDIEYYFSISNIFVLPSRAEGFSNSLTEALLYGIPCVSTDVSSAQELIKHNFNGKISKNEDSKDLANCIKYCVDNKEEVRNWGERSYLKLKEEIDFSIISKSYIDLYRKINSSI